MQRLALVYPDKLPQNRKELISFYDNFINQLIENPSVLELTIIHKAGLKEKLKNKFPSSKIKLIEFNSVQDIWIRDYAPFYTNDTVAFKGIYNPCYYFETGKKTRFVGEEEKIFYYASLDDEIGFRLPETLNIKTLKINLTIDGGNFIHNGDGVAITTNRIVSENESLSIQKIEEVFRTTIGITKLIILPVEPGDITGHIDGMVRFINKNTVLVGAYNEDYPEGMNFMNEIAKQLESDFNVIRIINEKPNDLDIKGSTEMASAFGNYINYLQVENTIFLPQYGIIEKDNAAKEILEKYFNVIPIITDIDKLSNEGGVLNCITWNY